MACLEFTAIPVESGALTVQPTADAVLSAEPWQEGELSAQASGDGQLSAVPADDAVLTVMPVTDAILTIGEICTVAGGTIVVLAAQDGPLRLANGGYLLLNPATNPPEN